MPKNKVAEHLKTIAKAEKIEIDDEAVDLIATHGKGSFRDSISLLDQIRNQTGKISADNVLETIGLAPSQVIDSIKQAIVTSDKLKLLRILSDIDNNGYDPSVIASQLAENIRTDILEDRDSLSSKQSLSILGGLLDVPGSSNSGVALELVLLGTLEPTKTVSKPTKTAEAKVEIDPEVVKTAKVA